MPLHIHLCMYAKSLQSCLTLCDAMDCSPSGCSVHGILQTRILEWVAIPSSRGSSRPRDRTHVSYISCIGRWFLTTSATWEAHTSISLPKINRLTVWSTGQYMEGRGLPCATGGNAKWYNHVTNSNVQHDKYSSAVCYTWKLLKEWILSSHSRQNMSFSFLLCLCEMMDVL